MYLQLLSSSSDGDGDEISRLGENPGAYAGGGVHWVYVHPPHLGKKFRSEMSKRGEKVPPRYVGKKECARSAQIPQN